MSMEAEALNDYIAKRHRNNLARLQLNVVLVRTHACHRPSVITNLVFDSHASTRLHC